MALPAEISYPHVEMDGPDPRIAGTTMKVVELVAAQRAHGWSPEELHLQFPHLSMAQIHGGLTYYWDHRESLDADLERRSQRVEAWRTKAPETALDRRLRAAKYGT